MTIQMNCQIYWGGRYATWSTYMSFNNRKTEMTIQMNWQMYLGGRSATWSTYMSFNNRNQKWPFRWKGRCTWGVDMPLDLPIWALTIESRNDHSDELADLLGGRSTTWSAYMSFNKRNQKWPFRWTGRCTWGVDMPLDLPIWALTIEKQKWPFRWTARSTGG